MKEPFERKQPTLGDEEAQSENFQDLALELLAATMKREPRRPKEELSAAQRKYLSLTEKLLGLEENRKLSYVDVLVVMPADEVLARLEQTRIGTMLLAGDDDQLALPSVDDYYPALDIRKSQSELLGAGVRVWGWGSGESASRNLELELFYRQKKEQFTEVIGLEGSAAGGTSATGSIVMPAYAETGYEGHNFKTIYDITDQDIADFSELVDEAAGGNPESHGMRQERLLKDAFDRAATPEAREAMQMVLERTWAAQAAYVLTRRQGAGGVSIAEMAADPNRVQEAIDAMMGFLSEWPLSLPQ